MTKRGLAGVLVAVAVVAVGCSDPAGSPDAPGGDDAPSDGPAPSDAPAVADASPIDGATAIDSASADALADCPAGSLCLHVNPVVPGATIPDGRLVVMFYQLFDLFQSPPPFHVALDIPFAGSSTRIDVDLASLVLPIPLDGYEVCTRGCLDLTNPACNCVSGQPRAAPAPVYVIRDADMSGAIELAELVEENVYGVGYVELGVSDASYPAPNVLDWLFTEGILPGILPYEIIDVQNEIHDVLGIPPAGTVFDLDVCVPQDASCDMMRIPNLT
jgi:hypothetical protein